MDGDAANSRLDIMQRLRDGRGKGCTRIALFNAAAYGHLEATKWLINYFAAMCLRQKAVIPALVVSKTVGHDNITRYLQGLCSPLIIEARVEAAAAVNHFYVVKSLVPGDISTSETL
ncbi:Ankyrin repeat-containing domain [Phytophthora cactorum]|nr:Ankyrin repeat-containing domain [Phytophthora cactorum]